MGRALLELLSRQHGIRVLVLRRKGGRPIPPLPGVCQRVVSFSSSASLARAFLSFRPQAVVHAAATGMEIPRPSLLAMVDANVTLPLRLLQQASRCGPAHFIMVSTGLAYRDQGRPLQEEDPLGTVHPYAATKAVADLLLRAAGPALRIRLTVLRPFSFTGPGDKGSRLFPSLLRAASRGKKISLTGGRQIRDFLSSADVASGVLAALRHPPASSLEPAIYNLGSAKPFPLRQVIEDVVQSLGLRVKLGFGKRETDPHEPRFLVADVRRAARQLGWKARNHLSCAVWLLAKESFPRLRLADYPKKGRKKCPGPAPRQSSPKKYSEEKPQRCLP